MAKRQPLANKIVIATQDKPKCALLALENRLWLRTIVQSRMAHTMPRMIAARNPNATIVANAVNLAVISIGSLLPAGCGSPH